MWPYRPWLFKAQNPGQAIDNSGMEGVTSSDPLPEPQSESLSPSQGSNRFQSPSALQYRSQPLLQPQAQSRSRSQSRHRQRVPVRDWTRRYQPSVNSRVYGYPSTGGVLILPGYHIDLPYLGLERSTEAKRSPHVMEEDAFCRRLRYLGAIWWQYPDADLDALKGRGFLEDTERAAIHVSVGWLANGGGVWVLKYSENEDDDNELSLKAQRIGSLNMLDRCRMIEQLGGKYYKHPEECEDLRWGNWPVLH